MTFGKFITALVFLLISLIMSATSFAAEEHSPADVAHQEGAEAESPNPMAIDPDLAIWTFVVFIVLLLVLSKFAWGPIVEALENREKGIADNIAAAEATKEEARRLLADYERKLADASNEVRELLEEARRDAEHTKGQILAEAKAAAEAEHRRATREVNSAKDVALHAIAEAGADMAVDLASRIVKKQLNAADHTQLIREAVAQFPQTKPSEN